jgi:hypothetical protein
MAMIRVAPANSAPLTHDRVLRPFFAQDLGHLGLLRSAEADQPADPGGDGGRPAGHADKVRRRNTTMLTPISTSTSCTRRPVT